jgi:hypothetical protein
MTSDNTKTPAMIDRDKSLLLGKYLETARNLVGGRP